MDKQFQLNFESRLNATPEKIWQWMTSLEGIVTEMRPLMIMTSPKGVKNILDVKIALGKPLFRSYIFLFGFIPADYSNLTLIELDDGNGFIEQSTMGSMKLWRHERRIIEMQQEPSISMLRDTLTFQPRFASELIHWFVRRIFEHRHAVLRRWFNKSTYQTTARP